MEKLITTEVAAAYTHCPRKAFLLLNTVAPPPPHEYESLCRARGGGPSGNGILNNYVGMATKPWGTDHAEPHAGHHYLLGSDLQAGDLSASCDVLERDRTRHRPRWGHLTAHRYSPGPTASQMIRDSPSRSQGDVLGLIRRSRPVFGRIITLDGVAHKVVLADGYRKIASVLDEIRALADRDLGGSPDHLEPPLPPLPVPRRVAAQGRVRR